MDKYEVEKALTAIDDDILKEVNDLAKRKKKIERRAFRKAVIAAALALLLIGTSGIVVSALNSGIFSNGKDKMFGFKDFDEKKYELCVRLIEETKNEMNFEGIAGISSNTSVVLAENEVVTENLKLLGTEGIPYLVKYILEGENNGIKEALLELAASRLMGYEERVLADKRENGFTPYTPKYYAYNLYQDMLEDGKFESPAPIDEAAIIEKLNRE